MSILSQVGGSDNINIAGNDITNSVIEIELDTIERVDKTASPTRGKELNLKVRSQG